MPRGIPREPSTKKSILHRLKIARGHLDRVVRMVEQDEYCIDVVHQSQAVQSALRKADEEVLRHHLQTCVEDSIKNGDSEAAIEELMKVIERR